MFFLEFRPSRERLDPALPRQYHKRKKHEETQTPTPDSAVGVGAKSRDPGDIHTWPHSHYLVRQCNGGGLVGKIAAAVQAL